MTSAPPRVALYERLPEIYRIRDAAQAPPGQLRAFLAAVEEAFGAVHESIEALYDDLFIDTCDEWVIPYIADLVGTSHLSGDPRTLRADVADTIALRRRKGTRAALERLAANLTGWPCRCVELFEGLAWSQHLNHQRPDAGGRPPYGGGGVAPVPVRRGGTPPVRDPAMLSLLGTPFDPFAYLPDVKRADDGAVHFNLPNVAIFLWRLAAYRIPLAAPLAKGSTDLGPQGTSKRARHAVRFDLDPLDRPVRLFNTYRSPPLDATGTVQALTTSDAVPGPMFAARLTSGSEAGNPGAYVTVDLFDASKSPPTGLDLSDAGLQLYLPDVPALNTIAWTFRGDNLCAWEDGLRRPLQRYEIVIDPDIGRVLFGVAVAAERDALQKAVSGGLEPRIFAGYTYGAVGPVGAHPISRAPAPAQVAGVPVGTVIEVTALGGGTSLQSALDSLPSNAPAVVEIVDSLVHPLDPAALASVIPTDGDNAIGLAQSLVIRAADGERPTIALARPLRFRPVTPGDPSVAQLTVRFEGVLLTTADIGGPVISRAAVARLELDGCTLDPGGYRRRDGSRAPPRTAVDLRSDFGFKPGGLELDAFKPTPEIILRRTVTGPLAIDDRYRLTVEASIVDAGRGPGAPADAFAVGSATAPTAGWGPALAVRGAHFLGRVRVSEAIGSGGLFVHALEVRDHQRGCLKQCCFSGQGDRLPPNHACVRTTEAKLELASTVFGDPAYGQVALSSDHRIRDRGPGDDAIGAYGFLMEAHKWINLGVRLREFMPAGSRPLPIAVT